MDACSRLRISLRNVNLGNIRRIGTGYGVNRGRMLPVDDAERGSGSAVAGCWQGAGCWQVRRSPVDVDVEANVKHGPLVKVNVGERYG
jgi:hypothetical protein